MVSPWERQEAGEGPSQQAWAACVRGKGSPWKAGVSEGLAPASSQMESVGRLKFFKANKNLDGA